MSPHAATNTHTALEWDSAATPIPGETALGDRAVVAFAGDRVLAAAVDGLGHGAEAAEAAEAAAAVLEGSAAANPGRAVLECHRALRDTRGAALSVASIDLRERTVTWLGVGNVEARLLHVADTIPATESMLLQGGIVGHDLPRLSEHTTRIARGDMVIFATDGISRDFADVLVPSGSCRDIAERILQEHALGSDDALALVLRYLPRA